MHKRIQQRYGRENKKNVGAKHNKEEYQILGQAATETT